MRDIPTTVYNTIKYGIILGLSVSILVLIAGSILVHDTDYIVKHPKFFISETLIMGILTSIPIPQDILIKTIVLIKISEVVPPYLN